VPCRWVARIFQTFPNLDMATTTLPDVPWCKIVLVMTWSQSQYWSSSTSSSSNLNLAQRQGGQDSPRELLTRQGRLNVLLVAGRPPLTCGFLDEVFNQMINRCMGGGCIQGSV
jgi:hypothetical protein